jgi:hypothetical protein
MYTWNKPSLGAQIDRAHPLSRGLVSAILFNEGSGTIFSDIAGNYHSGVISGPIWTPGRGGQGLLFNANFATLIDSKKLSMIGSDATWSAWINQSTLTSYRGIIGNTFSNGWWLSGNAGKIGMWIGGAGAVYSSDTTMVVNRWYHIAATFISSTKSLRFYLDGKPDGTDTTANPIGDGGTTFYLGKDGRGTAQYYFAGIMGNIYIWNRALSGVEILDLYNNPYGMISDPQTTWLLPEILGEPTPPVGGGLEASMFFMV